MDAVPQFGPGDGFARADHLVEALVLGNLPTHRYRRHRHTAMFLQRPGRKAGTDDEAVRPRITRGDSQRERVTDEFRSSRSEEHTSELQSLMRISYAVFCLKKKKRSTT